MEEKTSNTISRVGIDQSTEEKGKDTVPNKSFQKPSRKTLLRIRYYELKVQLGDFWDRALIKIDKATFHKFLTLRKRLEKEEKECFHMYDACTNTDTSGYLHRSKCNVNARFHKNTYLVFEADDEDSDLEDGEIKDSSNLNKGRRKERGNARRRQETSFSVSNTNGRPQKSLRLSRTRRRSAEQTLSNESFCFASGDANAKLSRCVSEKINDENKKSEDCTMEGLGGKVDVYCQTAFVNGTICGSKQNTIRVLPNTFPTPFCQMNEPPEDKGPKKSLVDRLVALSCRKRSKLPESENVVVGFNIKPMLGKVGGRRKRNNNEDLVTTPDTQTETKTLPPTGLIKAQADPLARSFELPMPLRPSWTNENGIGEFSRQRPNIQGYSTLEPVRTMRALGTPRYFSDDSVYTSKPTFPVASKFLEETNTVPFISSLNVGGIERSSSFNHSYSPVKTDPPTIPQLFLDTYCPGSYKEKYNQLLREVGDDGCNNFQFDTEVFDSAKDYTDFVYVPKTHFTAKFHSLLQAQT